MNDLLIDVKDAVVSYPSAEGERIILNHVNLQVRRGELVTVVGPSGCGKSTLLRLVLGSQFPNSGLVLVDGKQVARVTRDTGIVYQTYSLFPHLTVLDNVALGMVLEKTNLPERFVTGTPVRILEALDRRIHRSTALNEAIALGREQENPTMITRLLALTRYYKVRQESRRLAAELLASCGLDPKKDGEKYPFELSGGMRQRVAIAQAMIMKPKILLMDEPFGALDHTRRSEMQDFIHEQWQRHGLTVFFVTHDLEEACKVGTRLICLSQFWSDANGKQGAGAKILIDKAVAGGTEKPSSFSGSDEFKTLVEGINSRGLKPNSLLPISARELTHRDAVAG